LVNEEGRALPGAAIRLVYDRWTRRNAAESEREISTGVTDEVGRFVFGYQDAPFCSCSLWADVGDGWRLVEILSNVDWDESEEEEELDLILRPRDFEFRFQVINQQGDPFEGVSVQLVAGEHGAPIEHLSARETNEDGALTWGPFAHGRWWADFSSPGYAPVRTSPYQHLLTDSEDRFYSVRMRQGRELSVKVVDPSGRPVHGALLSYSYENLGLPTYSRWTAKTDGRGEALIVVPAAGFFDVEAEWSGLSGTADYEGGSGSLLIRLAHPFDEGGE
jgi:hypothetical protein